MRQPLIILHRAILVTRVCDTRAKKIWLHREYNLVQGMYMVSAETAHAAVLPLDAPESEKASSPHWSVQRENGKFCVAALRCFEKRKRRAARTGQFSVKMGNSA